MTTGRIARYLDGFKNYLRLESESVEGLLRELDTHLEDKSQELREQGFPEEEAQEIAVSHFDPERSVARQIYEVYSQGSWWQALLASLPHLAVASLFALRAWQGNGWLAATIITLVLLSIIGFVFYGWQHGKPVWVFPWLGYLLIPVIITGILLVCLPGGWFWLAAIVYLPLAVFVLVSVTRQTLTRDWLYVSVMLLPLPSLVGWLLALDFDASIFSLHKEVQEFASWLALSFLILAITVTAFVRLRQRWLKLGTLLVLESLVLAMVALVSRGTIGFWLWLSLVLLSVFLLFSPAWLEHHVIRHR